MKSNQINLNHSIPKIKRFIDCNIPVTTCNFRCPYCYITQQRKFDTELPIFKHTPEEMAKALSYERLGGTCVLNLCGNGETLLPPEMPAIIEALLKENHVVMVVTNGSMTDRFKEIVKLPKEYLERLFFKFSYHYTELVRFQSLDKFFDNIKLVANAGISYTLEITPYDELIPYIDEIKKVTIEKLGIAPHISVARSYLIEGLPILTELSKEEYKKTWGIFDSELFNYKLTTFNIKRKEFCYAGDWTLFLELDSGNLNTCYMGDIFYNIYDNPEESIPFEAIGCNCREEHCYNSHGFIGFGTIPSLKAPKYIEMRDRIDINGNSTLSPTIKQIFSSKLIESNKEYSPIKKLKCTLKHSDNPFIKNAVNNLRKIKQRFQ